MSLAGIKDGAVCIGEGLAVLVAEESGPLENVAAFSRSAAGAEANVAAALAALGVRSAWVSRIGDDGFGRFLKRTFAERGVDVTGVETDGDRHTGVYFKERHTAAGHAPSPGPKSRMHYYRRGSAASAFSPDTLGNPAVKSLLERAGVVHTTGVTVALSDSAANLVLELVSLPRHFTFSFDLNWRAQLWKGREAAGADLASRIIARSDVVFLGSDEAEQALGDGDPERLRARFPEPAALIVKNDRHSVVAFVGNSRIEVPALPVDVAEQIGAGDAFAAGYLGGLLNGLTPFACLRQGHLLAAHAMTGTGDQARFDRCEVEAFLKLSPEAWAELHFEPKRC